MHSNILIMMIMNASMTHYLLILRESQKMNEGRENLIFLGFFSRSEGIKGRDYPPLRIKGGDFSTLDAP